MTDCFSDNLKRIFVPSDSLKYNVLLALRESPLDANAKEGAESIMNKANSKAYIFLDTVFFTVYAPLKSGFLLIVSCRRLTLAARLLHRIDYLTVTRYAGNWETPTLEALSPVM